MISFSGDWICYLLHLCIFLYVIAVFRERGGRLSDTNWTQTQNHLVRKRTLNHVASLAKNHMASLAKQLSVCLQTKWFWVRVQVQSLKRQISRVLRARSSLAFRQV